MGGVNAINYNLVNWKKEKMEKAADEHGQSGQIKVNKFGDILHTAPDEKRWKSMAAGFLSALLATRPE